MWPVAAGPRAAVCGVAVAGVMALLTWTQPGQEWGRARREGPTHPCDLYFTPDYFPPANFTGWALFPSPRDCRLLAATLTSTTDDPAEDRYHTHKYCSEVEEYCLEQLRALPSTSLQCAALAETSWIPLRLTGSPHQLHTDLRAWLTSQVKGQVSVIRCTGGNTTLHVYVTRKTSSLKEKPRAVYVLLLRGVSRAHFYAKWPLTAAALGHSGHVTHIAGLQSVTASWGAKLDDLLYHDNMSIPGWAVRLGLPVTLSHNSCPTPRAWTHVVDSLNASDPAPALRAASLAFNELDCAGAVGDNRATYGRTGRMLRHVEYMSADGGLHVYDVLFPGGAPAPWDALLAAHVTRLPRTATVLFVGDQGNLLSTLAQTSAFWHTDLHNPPLLVRQPNPMYNQLGVTLGHLQTSLLTHADVGHLILTLLTLGESREALAMPDMWPRRECGCAGMRLEPSVTCLCGGKTGSEVKVGTNDTIKAAMAEFAVGALNNRVQAYLQTSRDRHGTGLQAHEHALRGVVCPRLRGESFRHLGTWLSGKDTLSVELVVKVSRDPLLHTSPITYRVLLQRTFHRNVTLRLLHFWQAGDVRMREGGTCVMDAAVRGLCVCSEEQQLIFPDGLPGKTSLRMPHFGAVPRVEDIDSGCLYLVERRYPGSHSVALEAANVCSDRQYQLKLALFTHHMALSSPKPLGTHLPPSSHFFLLAAWQDVYAKVKVILHYRVHYTVLR